MALLILVIGIFFGADPRFMLGLVDRMPQGQPPAAAGDGVDGIAVLGHVLPERFQTGAALLGDDGGPGLLDDGGVFAAHPLGNRDHVIGGDGVKSLGGRAKSLFLGRLSLAIGQMKPVSSGIISQVGPIWTRSGHSILRVVHLMISPCPPVY